MDNKNFSDAKNAKQEFRCKLPASYGQGIYEERPAWVADPPDPQTAKLRSDDYDWGDPKTHGDKGKRSMDIKPYPLIKVGNSSFFLAHGDTLEQCPYDKHHQILTPRFGRHLPKCRRNYIKQREARGEKVEIQVCPHNSLHHIPTDLMSEHARTCAATLRYQQQMNEIRQLSMKTASPGKSESKPIVKVKREVASGDDDWEEESAAGSSTKCYNFIDSLAENGTCFMVPQGLSKSEKKEFRENERRRTYLIKERQKLIEEKQRKDAIRTDNLDDSWEEFDKKELKEDVEFELRKEELDQEIEERTKTFKRLMHSTRENVLWESNQSDDEFENEYEQPPRKKQYAPECEYSQNEVKIKKEESPCKDEADDEF